MEGILLVAHGGRSRDDGMEVIARRASEISGVPVRIGYKRFGEPRVGAALEGMAGDGIDSVSVVPMFMSDGRYASSIPRNLGLEPGSEEGLVDVGGRSVRVTVSDPVGCCPELPVMALSMIREACMGAERPGSIVSGHGTAGESERGIVERIASMTESEGMTVASCGIDDPEALRSAAEDLLENGCDRVAILPVRFTVPAIDTSGWDPAITVLCPLGTCQGMADLVCRLAGRLRYKHS